jgi:hypothetical protein
LSCYLNWCFFSSWGIQIIYIQACIHIIFCSTHEVTFLYSRACRWPAECRYSP